MVSLLLRLPSQKSYSSSNAAPYGGGERRWCSWVGLQHAKPSWHCPGGEGPGETAKGGSSQPHPACPKSAAVSPQSPGVEGACPCRVQQPPQPPTVTVLPAACCCQSAEWTGVLPADPAGACHSSPPTQDWPASSSLTNLPAWTEGFSSLQSRPMGWLAGKGGSTRNSLGPKESKRDHLCQEKAKTASRGEAISAKQTSLAPQERWGGRSGAHWQGSAHSRDPKLSSKSGTRDLT